MTSDVFSLYYLYVAVGHLWDLQVITLPTSTLTSLPLNFSGIVMMCGTATVKQNKQDIQNITWNYSIITPPYRVSQYSFWFVTNLLVSSWITLDCAETRVRYTKQTENKLVREDHSNTGISMIIRTSHHEIGRGTVCVDGERSHCQNLNSQTSNGTQNTVNFAST